MDDQPQKTVAGVENAEVAVADISDNHLDDSSDEVGVVWEEDDQEEVKNHVEKEFHNLILHFGQEML